MVSFSVCNSGLDEDLSGLEVRRNLRIVSKHDLGVGKNWRDDDDEMSLLRATGSDWRSGLVDWLLIGLFLSISLLLNLNDDDLEASALPPFNAAQVMRWIVRWMNMRGERRRNRQKMSRGPFGTLKGHFRKFNFHVLLFILQYIDEEKLCFGVRGSSGRPSL